MSEFPKGCETKEGRKRFATVVADEIRQGIAGRSKRNQRWDVNRQYYNNETKAGSFAPYTGAFATHYNVTQIKIDALGTNVVGTITAIEPYCAAESFLGQDVSEVQERVVHRMLADAGVEALLNQVSIAAGLFNHGYIRVEFDEGDEAEQRPPGLRLSQTDPSDQVIYPPAVPNKKQAKLIGRKFERRLQEIIEMQAAGEYLKDERPQKTMNSDGSGLTASASQKSEAESVDKLDDMIESWDCLRRVPGKDGKEEWWGITIAPQSNTLLRLEKYPYKCIFDAEFGYKPKQVKDGYWSSGSVGNDLQGVQGDVNELVQNMMNGLRFNIYGAVFGSAAGQGTQATQYGPGDVLLGSGLKDAQVYNPKADLSMIPQTLQGYLQHADQIARISPTAVGGGDPNTDTATEAQIAAAGQQSGINNYIQVFARGVEELYEIAHEILIKQLPNWFPHYAEALELDEEAIKQFVQPVRWKVKAGNVGATPAAQMAMARGLLESAGNPAVGFDPYAIGTAIKDFASRMGFPDADSIQLPRDPVEIVALLAEILQADPMYLAQVIEASGAAGTAGDPSGMGGMAEAPGDGAFAGLGMGGSPINPQGDGSMPPLGPPQIAGDGPGFP